MGCCSTFSLLVTLAFTGGFAAMIGVGATSESLSRNTAVGLVTGGSVCLVWSLVYLGVALGYSVCGSQSLDNTFLNYMSLHSERSWYFVTSCVCLGILSGITSIVLIAVGAAKSNTGLWAAGLANFLYTLVTGLVFIMMTFCCCTIGYSVGR